MKMISTNQRTATMFFNKVPRTRKEFDELMKEIIYAVILLGLATWTVGVWVGAIVTRYTFTH